MSRRNELRAPRSDDRADRRYAERLWAAAARGDRVAFDRIFETWLTKSYALAWRSCHDRRAAQQRVRTQMLEAVAASAAAAAPVATPRG
jgi:hypothetical protein